MSAELLTNAQEWLQNYSELLYTSFKASGLVEHSVTKGESREAQILDVLSKLLPTRVSIETNVVIINSSDVQSPKFDGALVNRHLWPRIFASDYTVEMIESVLASIEIKSSLDKAELDDIFGKSTKLRSMIDTKDHAQIHPFVTAFAYDCANMSLSFFDFTTAFFDNQVHSPSMICILNKGLFGIADVGNGKIIPIDEPLPNSLPVWYNTGKDTLQVYIYFLSRWITSDTGTAEAFRRYSNNLFSQMTSFSFDNDFITTIGNDIKARQLARNCFFRRAFAPIDELYGTARRVLGL